LVPSEPLRVTAVALTAATVNVDESPNVIMEGLATMVTLVDGFVTVTVTDSDAFPPGPLALATYVVVLAGLAD
jgi:hypothetical protein